MATAADRKEYGRTIQHIVNCLSDVQLCLEYIAKYTTQILGWKKDYGLDFEFDRQSGKVCRVSNPQPPDGIENYAHWELVEDHRRFCEEQSRNLAETLTQLAERRKGLFIALGRLPGRIQSRLSDCRRGRHWVTIVVRHCMMHLERWPRLPSRERWRPDVAVCPRRAPMPARLDHLLEYFVETDPTPIWRRLCWRIDGFIDDLAAAAWAFGSEVERTPDGPCGVFQWRHNGKLLEGKLPPKQWHLASILHGRIGKKVCVDELMGPGSPFDFVQRETVRRQGSNISACLPNTRFRSS